MIKLLKSLSRIKGFVPVKPEESLSPLANHFRGWFEIHIYDIAEELILDRKKAQGSGDKLVLIQIDIGGCRNRNLGKTEISKIEEILGFFHNLGKDIILRVSYDAHGKGMEREPSAYNQVLIHAEQVAKIVYENRDKIFLYQGLLVGRWGEMHSTKFLSTEKLRELNFIFESKLVGSVYRAVRRPVQWRILRQRQIPGMEIDPRGLGVFNDGMFGSESDLGTYDPNNKDTVLWETPWNRENEIDFLSNVADAVPFGGEAILGEGFATSHSTLEYIKELQKSKITYLNRHHDRKLLDRWKIEVYEGKGPWNGHSCFEYIEAHLGYRFVIKNVELSHGKEGSWAEITIDNRGFACIYREAEVFIEIEDGTDVTEYAFTERLNKCQPGSSLTIRTAISEIPGKYFVSARTVDNKTGILFANKTSDVKGRIYIGEIKVKKR